MNETKSMGSFISALRRSNGMTQKELAELLHVSDKAVSRWERDEASPDLSLLLPLSEILGVTADELLRGERITESNAESPASIKRAEASRNRILSLTLQTLRISGAGAILIALLGLIVAAICNNAFHRATLGFYLSCILHLLALFSVLVTGFVAMSQLLPKETSEEIEKTRRIGIETVALILGIILSSFVFSLPLILLPFDPYMGLTWNSWLSHGASYLLIAIPVQIALFLLIRALGTWLGFYPCDAVYQRGLKEIVKHLLRIAGILLAALLVIGLISAMVLGSISPSDLAKGKEFTDFESFKAFIEQPLPGEESDPDGETEVIYNWDNEPIYTYRNPREAVVHFTLTEDEKDVSSFTVYEETEWQRAVAQYEMIEKAFEAVAIWVIFSCLAGYLIKRHRILAKIRSEIHP